MNRRYRARFLELIEQSGRQLGLWLSPEEVAELSQELMLRFLTSKSEFKGTDRNEFWAFIRSSISNLLVDFVRKMNARRRRAERNAPIGLSGVFKAPRCYGVFASRERDPEQILLRKEQDELLDQRLHELIGSWAEQPLQVAALRLTYIEGLTSREAGERLKGGLSPRQIDHLIQRLRRALGSAGVPLNRRSVPRGEAGRFRHVIPPYLRMRPSRRLDPDQPRSSRLGF